MNKGKGGSYSSNSGGGVHVSQSQSAAAAAGATDDTRGNKRPDPNKAGANKPDASGKGKEKDSQHKGGRGGKASYFVERAINEDMSKLRGEIDSRNQRIRDLADEVESLKAGLKKKQQQLEEDQLEVAFLEVTRKNLEAEIALDEIKAQHSDMVSKSSAFEAFEDVSDLRRNDDSVPDVWGVLSTYQSVAGPHWYSFSKRKAFKSSILDEKSGPKGSGLVVADVPVPKKYFLWELGHSAAELGSVFGQFVLFIALFVFLPMLFSGPIFSLSSFLADCIFQLTASLYAAVTFRAVAAKVTNKLVKRAASHTVARVISPYLLQLAGKIFSISPFIIAIFLFLLFLWWQRSVKSCRLVLIKVSACWNFHLMTPNYDSKNQKRPSHRLVDFKPLIEVCVYKSWFSDEVAYYYYDAPHFFGLSEPWVDGRRTRVVRLLEAMVPTLLSRKTLYCAMKKTKSTISQSIDRVLRLAENDPDFVEDVAGYAQTGQSVLQDTALFCACRVANTATTPLSDF